jgi:coenzyme F420-reducing hydrogenase delta subunit
LLGRVDGLLNRLYGSRWNPIYQSGAVVVALFVLLLVTGVYLLLFYRVGSPYASTVRITEQVWLGRWIRGIHRFASDAALVAIAVHAVRMLVQGRSWGPRALAWLTGVGLLAVFVVSAWTGYVMVWDVQAQVLAVEGARLLDVLPIFSEPIARTFVGEQALPSAFFFMNLFLHVALPIGMAFLLWLHVARVARPVLWPPRRVFIGVTGALLAVSVLWPIGMSPEADLLRLPGRAEYDAFFSWWVPLSRALPAGVVWLLGLAATALVVAVPWLTRPRPPRRPAPSSVDARLCTGCEQCALDCPYEAITMVERRDGRATLLARVDPALCVSCGICAGSCAPMGVGPPGRTGRDQLAVVRGEVERGVDGVAVVACTRGAGGVGTLQRFAGARVYPIDCIGSMHSSVVELLVRGGADGVLVVGCPERDCWNREGAKWTQARLFEEREAELQARVDRRRVRLSHAGAAERSLVAAELESFRASLPARLRDADEDALDLVALCERAEEEA